MESNPVHFKLYIGDKTPGSQVATGMIETALKHIQAFQIAIKNMNEMKKLNHCDAVDLKVYKNLADSDKDSAALSYDDPVPEGTTKDSPLSVVAPARLAPNNATSLSRSPRSAQHQKTTETKEPLVLVTMTTKKITVDGVGVKLSSDAGLNNLLRIKFVEYLLDEDGDAIVDFGSIVNGGKYTLGPPQQQQDAPPAKKPKFELSSAQSNEEIFEFLEKCARDNSTDEDLRDFCYPAMVSETWNRDFLNKTFREKQQKIWENVRKDNDFRAPLVITVVEGFGNGKTHFLKAAPGFVGQETIFATFNQGQDLTTDANEPRKALLLRIILGTFGTGSFGASNFLTAEGGKNVIEKLDFARLLELTAERLAARFAQSTGFTICVDEVRKLETLKRGATSQLLSALGALARSVYKLPGKLQCTAVVSALDNDGIDIYTESGRTVETVKLPNVDRSAVDLVCRVLKLPKEHLWKVIAVAGSHFRSIVVAVNVLKEGNSHVDIERLTNLSFERLRQTLNADSIGAIGDYIEAMMEQGGKGPSAKPPLVNLNCSTDSAIPPALICVVCRENSKLHSLGADKHALGIFHNDIQNAAFDQLELSAMHFDLLRSVFSLHVVPLSMTVNGGDAWYSELRFQRSLQPSTDGILAMNGEKKVVWTGLVPKLGVYYHPGLANHPWIDRFFVAEAKNKERCLVLYQDKINSAGFPHAVEDLNLAAKILTTELSLPVLCIANVIGASDRTRSQSKFEYPYLLVRDSELDDFYTTNFATAMKFLRTRFREQGAETSSS